VLSLTIIQGPDRGRRFQLPDAEPQLIGRSSEALPITDNLVELVMERLRDLPEKPRRFWASWIAWTGCWDF